MTRKTEDIENLLQRIVANNAFSEQSEIQEKLSENGIDIPQPTLSRWLKKLHIAKINNRYQVVSQSTARIPILGIKASPPNIIVLHTLPGHASSLAIHIDQKMPKDQTSADDPYKGVLGTIAGDDTVLVIMENKESLAAFKDWLEQNFEL